MTKDIRGEKNPNFKTGYCSKRSSLYNSWCGMKARCLRKNHPKFHRYGGRGIKVFEDWLDFKPFLDWALANGWKEGLTIDRIDNNGNYCPENCRWVSIYENSRKKATTKLSNEDAEKIRQRKDENWYSLAKEFGCSHGSIWFIMHGITHVADGVCAQKLKEARGM